MHISVFSVLLLLLSCQASTTTGPHATHLLVIPQKSKYALYDELDPAKDLTVFLVWSDDRHDEIFPFDVNDPEQPNPDLRVVTAGFDIPGTQIVYVLYKSYYANYFILVYDPNAPGGSGDGTGDGTGEGTSSGGGPAVTINW
jgi:hypothetical protein